MARQQKHYILSLAFLKTFVAVDCAEALAAFKRAFPSGRTYVTADAVHLYRLASPPASALASLVQVLSDHTLAWSAPHRWPILTNDDMNEYVTLVKRAMDVYKERHPTPSVAKKNAAKRARDAQRDAGSGVAS